jgi:hypothetical protein
MLRVRLFRMCLPVVLLLLAATAAQATYMDAVMADNPVGYWRLGETGSTAALDSSGNANDGTAGVGVALGAVSGALVDPNKAATLDGTSTANVMITNGSPFNFDTANPFTLEGWAKITNTTSTNQAVIAKFRQIGQGGAADNMGYFMSLIKDGGKYQLLLQLGDSNGDYVYKYGSPVDLGNGSYHYVATTYSGSGTLAGMKLYVDGSEVTTLGGSGSSVATLTGSIQTPQLVHLGVREPNLALTGELDEAAIYGNALSGATIGAHYLAGTTVPEPTALVLMATGVIGLLAYAWRKRK